LGEVILEFPILRADVMAESRDLQASITTWQIAIQEILHIVIRDMCHANNEAALNLQITLIEEAAINSIHTDLWLRETDDWNEMLVKEKASIS
jgi:hypothetical protein